MVAQAEGLTQPAQGCQVGVFCPTGLTFILVIKNGLVGGFTDGQ